MLLPDEVAEKEEAVGAGMGSVLRFLHEEWDQAAAQYTPEMIFIF